MAYAYLVTGSEDGPLGIYSSKTRALDAAIAYVEHNGEVAKVETFNSGYTSVDRIDGSPYATASVERFYLN